MPKRGGLLEGWRLTAVIAVMLSVAVIVMTLYAGGDIEGLRLAIRATARTSIALFLAAFTASSLAQLFPSPFTRWQLRNRRYLGLSFAVSHLIHAIVLLLLFQSSADLFWSLTNVGNVVSGGIAYAFIFAMAATSFDRTVAWLGPRAWRVLHLTGGWYIWISFVIAFGKRTPVSVFYWIPVAILILALAVRVLAALQRRRYRAA